MGMRILASVVAAWALAGCSSDLKHDVGEIRVTAVERGAMVAPAEAENLIAAVLMQDLAIEPGPAGEDLIVSITTDRDLVSLIQGGGVFHRVSLSLCATGEDIDLSPLFLKGIEIPSGPPTMYERTTMQDGVVRKEHLMTSPRFAAVHARQSKESPFAYQFLVRSRSRGVSGETVPYNLSGEPADVCAVIASNRLVISKEMIADAFADPSGGAATE